MEILLRFSNAHTHAGLSLLTARATNRFYWFMFFSTVNIQHSVHLLHFVDSCSCNGNRVLKCYLPAYHFSTLSCLLKQKFWFYLFISFSKKIAREITFQSAAPQSFGNWIPFENGRVLKADWKSAFWTNKPHFCFFEFVLDFKPFTKQRSTIASLPVHPFDLQILCSFIYGARSLMWAAAGHIIFISMIFTVHLSVTSFNWCMRHLLRVHPFSILGSTVLTFNFNFKFALTLSFLIFFFNFLTHSLSLRNFLLTHISSLRLIIFVTFFSQLVLWLIVFVFFIFCLRLVELGRLIAQLFLPFFLFTFK